MSLSRRPRNQKPNPPNPEPRTSYAGPKRIRCGECLGCLAIECGTCIECKRKTKFGGDGSSKQCCINRRCLVIHGNESSAGPRVGNARRSSPNTSQIANIKPLVPSLLEASPSRKKQKKENVVEEIYGLPVQQDPGDVLCAGCLQPQEAVDDAVLLCDGPGCGREYHLSCCDPPVEEIPKGSWFCQDCSKEGTTRFLREYLEASDQKRSLSLSSKHYVKSLLQTDLNEYQAYRLRETGRNQPSGIPVSELSRAHELHSAIGETESQDNDTYLVKQLIGKPIRIYDRLSNHYHSGRLVDYRSLLSCGSVEFLVRFPAGKDGRKTSLFYWIVLEEHSLAVESMLVWAQKGQRYVPGQYYLRTARELLSVQHLYSQEKGQISYVRGLAKNDDVDHEKLGSTEILSSKPQSPKKKQRTEQWGLVRLFGNEEFLFLRLSEEVHRYGDKECARFARSQDVQILMSLAEVELAEQEDTVQWYSLPSGPQTSTKSLSRVDQQALRPLLIRELPEYHSALVPSIPQGLDHLYILKHLRSRGVDVSKDGGAFIECTEVPIETSEYEREKLCS